MRHLPGNLFPQNIFVFLERAQCGETRVCLGRKRAGDKDKQAAWRSGDGKRAKKKEGRKEASASGGRMSAEFRNPPFATL